MREGEVASRKACKRETALTKKTLFNKRITGGDGGVKEIARVIMEILVLTLLSSTCLMSLCDMMAQTLGTKSQVLTKLLPSSHRR